MIQTFIITPVIELVAAVSALVLYLVIWRRDPSKEEPLGERELGANVIIGQLTGVITAGAVIFGLLGAFTVLALDKPITSDAIKTHLYYAILWSSLSLVVAVYNLGVVPSYVTKYNVVRKKSISIVAMLSLTFFLFSVVRFWCALSRLLV